MKDIISPVETADNLFHDGDPATGAEGTVVHAKWLNAIQGAVMDTQTEQKNILAAAGMQPNPAQNNQLTEALKALIEHARQASEKRSLLRKNNGADIPDKAAFVGHLGLKDTVEQAQNALDKRTGGTVEGDIISLGSHIILKGDESKHFAFQDNDGLSRMVLYKDKGGDGVRLNNGDEGRDWLFHINGHFHSPGALHAADATFLEDGNIHCAIWEGNLKGWLDDQLSRRTTKNTAHNAPNGWWKCGDTGLMFQWGREYSSKNESFKAFPTRFSRACFSDVLTPQNGASGNNTVVNDYTADGFKVWTYNSGADFLWLAVGE